MSQSSATDGQPEARPEEFDVVVVGGGVAGLYCAWKLSMRSPNLDVGLFEASGRWGGRIETRAFRPFPAEFGPMRYERHGQKRLMGLLVDLDLFPKEFEPYQAERPDFPVYDLTDSEKGPPPFENRHTTLELLKLGIIRIFEDTQWQSPGDRDDPRDPKHDRWLGGLTEKDYAAMRKRAKWRDQFLHDLGLWNALSEVLSHQALMKIRDLGTFYHLLPENPNAIEWIVFWLRAFDPKDRLVTVQGGSEGITKGLVAKLTGLTDRPGQVSLQSNHALTLLKPDDDGWVSLKFAKKGKEEKGAEARDTVWKRARHVVLALPKGPLAKLGSCFEKETQDDVDAVFGFPLLKCFFLVKEPWWDRETKAQSRASLMPTREVHYFYDEKEDKGMVMLYTDRPATEFWKLYVKDENHEEAEINGDKRLPRLFFKYLVADLKREAGRHPHAALETSASGAGSPDGVKRAAVRSTSPAAQDGHLNGAAQDPKKRLSEILLQLKAKDADPEKVADKIVKERVEMYGIRDWSREPYGAACHVWRPGVESWKVLDRLKAFSLAGAKGDHKNVHVCGEAYSDYHGFIEGALQSADVVLETMGRQGAPDRPQGEEGAAKR